MQNTKETQKPENHDNIQYKFGLNVIWSSEFIFIHVQ